MQPCIEDFFVGGGVESSAPEGKSPHTGHEVAECKERFPLILVSTTM